MEINKTGTEKISPDDLTISQAYGPGDRYAPKQWMNYLINLHIQSIHYPMGGPN